jgi:peptidyl-prolyl cis-trans isomerase D
MVTMLQKIRAHTQGWLAWALVIVLGIVFVLWGISGELISNPGEKAVAKVAGTDITAADLQTVYERLAQQNQMAQIMAGLQMPNLNEEMIRKQALDSLIMERVLTHAAIQEGFMVTPDQVNSILIQLPQFQVNGKFAPTVYERIIRQMNFTPQSFRNTVQNEMLITQTQSSVRDSVFLLPYQLDEAIELVNQTRDIQYVVFKADTFAHEVNLTPEDLEAYYNGHQSEFMTEETVKLSYVTLDKNALAAKIRQTEHPTDAQLHEAYESEITRFSSPELRHAKHILIAVKPDATPADREAAKAKAQSVVDQLKAGASFAELAKKDSADPGSAEKGGDLGAFGRGEMVPEFEEAVFKGKPGDLVGPVKTDFGYHVILIGKIQPSVAKSFEEVKTVLAKEWFEEKIVDQYEKEVNDLDQMAFENADSLDKVAQSFSLPINTLTLQADPDKNTGLGKHPEVQKAAFSEDVLYSRKNSEVIRTSPDAVIVLRVLEHQTPALKPFESVKADLHVAMKERQGILLARQKANSIIDAFNQGANLDELAKQQGFTLKTVKNLGRQPNNPELPLQVVQAAFSMPQTGPRPAVTGAELPAQGTALVAVDAIHLGKIDPQFAQTMKAEFSESLHQFKGVRDFNFYVFAAKEKAKVEME